MLLPYRPTAAAVFASLLLLSGLASATTPAAGTLNNGASAKLSAKGGPYVVANPTGTAGEANCDVPMSCDDYALTVDLPMTYAATNPNDKVQIDLVIDDGTSDLDLSVLDSKGNVVGKSASDPGVTESVTLPAGAGLQKFTVRIIPFASANTTATLTIKLVAGSSAPAADPCAPTGSSTGSVVIAPSIATAFKTLPAATRHSAFVHFSQGTGKAHRALIEGLGLSYGKSFEKYASSVYVSGPLSALQQIAQDPSVSYLEDNAPLRYTADTDVWSTRARVAQEPVSGGPYYDAKGHILDGTGVTISVVDSGLFGAHPDFAGRIIHNYKIAGNDAAATAPPVDVGYTNSDTTGGHGTHCNGIAAGGGQSSDGVYPVAGAAPTISGTYTGVAPKASLWAYGVGETLAVFAPDAAFQDILDQYPKPTDANYGARIRVISNSYGNGAGSTYNPADTSSCLVKALVAKGVALTYAASNDGGDGSTDRTSSTCKDPTPGVICVASYNDSGVGGRDRPLSGFSSRGKRGDPTTYPDIAAPGDLITATCEQPAPGQAVCATGAETSWQPYYGTISGTSMATPHTAGILALMFQANPALTPAQAEKMLQDHARKVGRGYEPDPQNPGGTINYGYGAGLVDLPAVLEAMGIRKAGLPVKGAEYTVIDGDTETVAATDAAANAVKLTLQEETLDGKPGITCRLTVGNAASAGFTSAKAVTYQVQQNVGGVHFAPSVVLTPDGKLKAVGGAGNPVVTHPAVKGNVLSFFVAYDQLGYPKIAEPIANIRVVTLDDSGNEEDLAPSPADSPTALADTQPMYGRPFTVQLDAGPAPITEFSCKLPGLTVITDARGDSTGGVAAGDLLSVQMAEPGDHPGQLAFTIKVGSLSPLTPNMLYAVRFFPPVAPETVAPNSVEPSYFVGMSTYGGTAAYVYGRASAVDAVETSVATFQIDGAIDKASHYDATTGTITLFADKKLFGPLNVGDGLVQLVASARVMANDTGPIGGRALDSAEGDSYYLAGTACLDASGLVQGAMGSGTGTSSGTTPPIHGAGPTLNLPVGGDDRDSHLGGAFGALMTLPLLLAGLWRRRRGR